METNPMGGTDLQARMQRIQDNLQMMHTYFDALFGKDLTPIFEMIDEHIEWLIVPTGDTLKGKEQIAKLASQPLGCFPRQDQDARERVCQRRLCLSGIPHSWCAD